VLKKKTKKMNRLLDIGFISVGYWKHQNSTIKYELSSHHTTANVLYSFISNGCIKYIGKTKMQLSQRMYGYQNPGPSQATNIRINAYIKRLLNDDQPLDILILVDNGLLKYGTFKINLAAGLEDTLIYEISPEWNLLGRNIILADMDSEKPELTKEPKRTTELISTQTSFDVVLGQAYYNQGFFNVRRKYSHLFGTDKSIIDIYLGSGIDRMIQGYINRTANSNGTPRIMGGKTLKDWIKDNFKPNENITVEIISRVTIRLH
jgi:hypothetical protein